VFYGGVRLNSEIVEREQAASLLVNPWPTQKEYVKEFLTYSFPSKNMEYMASGTPVLTTVLPGMPKEYYPYVYLLEEETADGIANALTEIFAQGDELMLEKGKAAKKFVMETRNNVVQAAKILEMLKNEG
jgi:glycosyltransferase involved in cell wall biosynthesis